MAWVKLDDKFTDHPKLVSVGPLGIALQVAALCYSNTHLTDGFIPYNAARKLLGFEFSPPNDNRLITISITCGMSGDDVTWELIAGWLVDAGIWEEVEGGYFIHDYLDYQPSKDDVLKERSKAQQRMSRLRSGEVRANNEGTSEMFGRSSDAPNPYPINTTTTTTPPPANNYPIGEKVICELAHWPNIPNNQLEQINSNLSVLTLRQPTYEGLKKLCTPYATEYYNRYPARTSVGWLDWAVMEKIPPNNGNGRGKPGSGNPGREKQDPALVEAMRRQIQEAKHAQSNVAE